MNIGDTIYVRYDQDWHEAIVKARQGTKFTVTWVHGEWKGEDTPNVDNHYIFPLKKVRQTRFEFNMQQEFLSIKEEIALLKYQLSCLTAVIQEVQTTVVRQRTFDDEIVNYDRQQMQFSLSNSLSSLRSSLDLS